MNLPEVLTVTACTLWAVALVTVLRPHVKGWRVNRKEKRHAPKH